MTANNIERLLKSPKNTFFLFGPRGVGKSTWLKTNFKKALYLDLLRSDLFLPLSNNPSRIDDYCRSLKAGSWVVIDEIQKIPSLLDEVHRLIEDKQFRFALSGSSARKLRRSGANLLAGRAIQNFLFPLSIVESKQGVEDACAWGTLPLVVARQETRYETLSTYIETYLKEEIKAEGLVRRVEPFSRFLEVAGLYNAQILNIENLAREAHTPRTTVERYFEILEDTLIASRLKPLQLGMRPKEVTHPKFYFFDPGVARAAAHLLKLNDAEMLGRSFENLVYHELSAFIRYQALDDQLFFYRSGDGFEVDFIVQTRPKTLSKKASGVAIEVKYSHQWDRRWNKNLLEMRESSKIKIEKVYGIYLGPTKTFTDGVQVYSFTDFIKHIYKLGQF